jgi:hypothetical protein
VEQLTKKIELFSRQSGISHLNNSLDFEINKL